MRSTLVLILPLLLAACPGEETAQSPKPPPVKTEPATPVPEVRADGRLPTTAIPTRYTLDLDLDPRQPRFKGLVNIEIDVPEQTSFIVLNQHGLEITAARAETARAPMVAKVSTRLAHGGKAPEELVLAFDAPVPKGHATLVIDYTGPFDDELSGLYRLKDGELWYAFSQFEPTDARRAFPCFDEPAFKTPFDVSISVPKPMTAFANAHEASREESADKTKVRFARTEPLPTYLVAFAAGELETKDATRYTRPPIRIITTKGKTGMSSLALETTGALVDALGEWFGMPYPYDKLDIVAVPDFRSGAMENAGLITFREERLLLDPARASVAARRGQATIIAHELAHQWFGDLVTATWWNDLWLNEGMATWMEARIVDKWRPAFNARLDAQADGYEAMDIDGLGSARAVRQPVNSTSDADEAFDGITYEKGAALITAIERWIGEDVFQKGVREYLKENKWKSVTAEALLTQLDKASGKDVTQMALSYLDKSGVPEVSAALSCEPGRWHVDVSSGQWRPLGTSVPEMSDRMWMIPFCVRPQGDKKDACADLVAGAPTMIVGKGCPSYFVPTFASYARVAMAEKDFVKLAEARATLDVPTRIAVLSNAWAAVRSGALEPKALLKILPPFDDDNTRQVVEQIVTILHGMSDILVDEDARVPFRKFALQRLQKRKKTLGWTVTSKSESQQGEDALARRAVLVAMGDVVEDEATLKEAEEVAQKWLTDSASVDADIGTVALDLASRKAPEARIAALRGAMTKAKTREDRIVAIKALMGFEEEARVKQALDVVLTDEIRANELRYVMGSALRHRKSKRHAEAWVRAHWAELEKKFPGALVRPVLEAASVGCTKKELDERTEFYTPKVQNLEGAARPLASALENVSLCTALRDSGSLNLRKALLGKK